MKNILLLFSASLFSLNIFAQGDVVFRDLDFEEMGDTLEVIHKLTEDDLSATYHLDGYISNTSTGTKNIRIQRTIIDYVEGAGDEICWGGQCIPYNATQPETITGDQDMAANEDFSLQESEWVGVIHYRHLDNVGTTTIKYELINASDVVEDVLVVKFTLKSGVSVNSILTSNFDIYPNPCSSTLNLENLENAKSVTISNMLGQNVFTSNDVHSSISIDMSNLNNGVYFTTIITSDNKIYTERIIKR